MTLEILRKLREDMESVLDEMNTLIAKLETTEEGIEYEDLPFETTEDY